jgi:hypothetical protein
MGEHFITIACVNVTILGANVTAITIYSKFAYLESSEKQWNLLQFNGD